MAFTYTWVISQLDSYPEHEGHQDVVFVIHWRRQATDGTLSAEACGKQGVSLDPDAPFTPYADLTFEQVCGWLENTMGVEQIAILDAGLGQEIQNQISPPIVILPLPWAQEAE